MVRTALAAIFSLMVLANATVALEAEEQPYPSLHNRHQAGVRLGTWVNLGDTPPESISEGGITLETNINNVNFYFEGYFAYNIFSAAYIELSAGIVNRGSVTVRDFYATDVGNLILYPILLQFKYYPFSTLRSKFQPYIAAGGGLYYGRQDVQFTTDPFFDPYRQGDSETDFNYTLSGGINWVFNRHIALETNIKYMPIKFSENLILVNDYEALAITVGITYLHGGRQ